MRPRSGCAGTEQWLDGAWMEPVVGEFDHPALGGSARGPGGDKQA